MWLMPLPASACKTFASRTPCMHREKRFRRHETPSAQTLSSQFTRATQTCKMQYREPHLLNTIPHVHSAVRRGCHTLRSLQRDVPHPLHVHRNQLEKCSETSQTLAVSACSLHPHAPELSLVIPPIGGFPQRTCSAK